VQQTSNQSWQLNLPAFRGCNVDTQVVELLGRNRLISELLHAGLEVAVPQRDRGVDLIAYLDLESHVSSFVARPIQMKAPSHESFSVYRKYSKICDLILSFVWNLEHPEHAVTYALTYPEAVTIADEMGWTKTSSWLDQGGYSTSSPGKKLLELLGPHKMSPALWRLKIVGSLGCEGLKNGQ
jgi:hypothetical protein